ncbi:hypothetical protein AB6A40_004665 [Gnathostoma spinigerum]|uniref:Senescence domain-containing protein n=1 Tax=Gnathostoma spinigerum TaxID=75299 RepID=A0ABD6EFF9_9BILA
MHADDYFSEVFARFERGLCFDEAGDKDNAVLMYEQGVKIFKDGAQMKDAKSSELYEAMFEAAKRAEQRLAEIKDDSEEFCQKKSYQHSEAKEDQTNISLRDHLESVGSGNAELIFFIPDGVQVFMIEGDSASTPTRPSALEVFRLTQDDDAVDSQNGEVFIKVGPWVYPLIRGKTPMLKNDIGAYVVPNPTPDHPDMYVGIILPSDIEDSIKESFLNLVSNYTELRSHAISRTLSAEEKQRVSEKISQLLIKGGEKIAWNVHRTATKASGIVSSKSANYRSRMSPVEKEVMLNPTVRNGVHYFHKGSKIMARCTRHLLNMIGDLGVAVGKSLASNADKYFGGGENGGLVSDTITVVGGGVVSVSTVWMALENASKSLCRNIADESVETIRLKYGDEVSTTAHEAFYGTGHTALAAFHIWDLGPRSIAGRAARKAGTQFIIDMNEKSHPFSNQGKIQQAGSDLK